ncbi:pentatricopeptide repeat-containing protein At3g29230-like [Carica papaya]|uniref:pentatricopeptide repeat-containing protein At3g29230-like n=1 Tax=Carica papaya TaxID=3649 RepID=UPI000B8CB9E7|nr:pentatricopeptide repeat-containing protein At3g29230-like [Carica papaya]
MWARGIRMHKLQFSSMKEVEQIQASIIKAGLYPHSPIISKLIAFASLSPSGCLAHAQSIFHDTTMDNTFLCNVMIRAYSRSVFPIKAFDIYNHMQYMNIESDHFTYSFVLRACARVLWCMRRDVKYGGLAVHYKIAEIHCRVLKLGFDSDQYIGNSFLHLYNQCGLLDVARRVFDEMPDRNVTSWNIMISAYDQVNDFETADYLLDLMPRKNVVSWNTLIRRYVRLGDMEAATAVFQEMGVKDSVSWNSMIAGYIHVRDYSRAHELHRQMQVAGLDITDVTLTSILGACAETGALQIGREIHEFLKQRGFNIEGYLGIALIDMYAKCGSLSCAWEVFNEFKMKPVGCWNAMIVGLAVHGNSKEALELFASMEKRIDQARPNRITFIAHQIIKTMPFDANSVLWRTLLGACKIYGNMELAEESFKRLTELEPLTDGDFILLSNVYAEAERWNGVEAVRNEMIDVKVPKKPGFSQI